MHKATLLALRHGPALTIIADARRVVETIG